MQRSQQHFPKEISELMKKVKNLSEALMFTYLNWSEKQEDDGSSSWKSQSFKPVSNTHRPKNESDLEHSIEQATLKRPRKVSNPLYMNPKKHVEACGWPNSAHGFVEITNSHTKSI